MIIGIGGIDHIGATQIQAAMIRSIHDLKCQRIILDIASGEGNIHRGILIGDYRLILGDRDVVDRAYLYRYRRRVKSPISVANGIVKTVASVEIWIRGVDDVSVRVYRRGTVGGIAQRARRQGIVIHIGIVGQNVDSYRCVLIGCSSVVIGYRGIVDRIDCNRHCRRIGTTLAVVHFVSE